MKINFENNSSDKNKSLHIHSVVYPAGGFVAMPKNNRSGLKEKKRGKKLKRITARVDIIKP